jgi:tetratricopeptide (TPR) repeat protein
MMHRLVVVSIALFFWSVGILGEHVQAFADDRGSPWVSKVISIQGRVTAKRRGQTGWQPVKLNDTLFAGDRIQVEANSRAGIVLSNDAVLRLDQNTTLVFTEIEKETTFIFKLLKGAANFFSRRPRSLKILTPFVNGVVEGTEFFVQVDEDQTRIDLFEGRIRAENQYGEIQLAKGQGALATADSAPQRQILVKPRESVQWALYYPPVLALGPGEVSDELQASLVLSDQGRFPEAIDTLEQIPESDRDARFFTYRAALLLHVGRVIQARGDIEQALALDPNSGDALSLHAVIAVVQNDKDRAMIAALKAVKNNPRSAAAQMALSYAHQAAFDLPEALEAAQAATSHSPESGTAWARLAELRLSTGKLDKGIHAARKAAKLNPKTAHAHTILGFAYLTQIKTEKAQAAFEKAITQDSAAPLPRLGLGLAKIRGGNLEQGRAEIEIAAGLDPVNALIRSYLGKAYFDEKRSPLDEKQLEIAKTLDPSDPTAWYYDAIRKLALNRPVEALQDLQKSIELNDSRAVYRSRLLLDDDLAARSAGLGRIYNDLGFQQLALVEGWKSVNSDSSNHSAHRFLSDSYTVLPRHEVARVSELLQSQLLQPINMTPVQPQLHESDFFILEGSGPAEPSLNEFNPLFHRNRNSLLASGVIGENGIRGDELVFSGLWQKVSYGIGQFHYETDGFRENNDLNRDNYNVFVQTSLTNKTSIMTEGRYTESEQGDLPLRFPLNGQDIFSSNLRQDKDEKSLRLGMKHTFSPRSQIISHFTYVSADESVQDLFGTNSFEVFLDDTGYMGEGQYLWSGNRFRLTGGLGYFDRDRELTTIYFGEDTAKYELTHTNFYVYSYISYPKKYTWTIGGSVDIFDDDETKDRHQFNPKFGLLVTPFTGTSLRAAVFRTVKRSLAGQQTIEPTQVAGFNQFYDDLNGASSWRYGLAVDQTISPKVHGGIEYSTRDIDSPSFDIRTFEIVDSDWIERLTRAYLYWTPNALFAMSAEYLFEEFHRENYYTGIAAVKELKTHRFPLGVNFFHPNGLSASLKCTYVNQEGIFGTEPADYRRGEDYFWLFDVGLRYRFPNRMGLLSVGVQNLFDNDFNFQDMDLANQTIFPERTIYGKVTFSF